MLNNNYNIKQIKRYIQNKMSDTERYAFERNMEADPFLKDAVEGYEKTNIDNIESTIDLLKSKTLTFRNLKTRRMWIRAAASIIILLGISTLFYISNHHSTNKQLSINQNIKELDKKETSELKSLQPFSANLPDSDLNVSELKEPAVTSLIDENTSITKQPKLNTNNIQSQPNISTKLATASEIKTLSSTTGEIKGELITKEQNIGRSKKMIIKNGREVPADEYFEVKNKEVDINGYDTYGNKVTSNAKAETNSYTFNNLDEELAGSPELNKKYFSSPNKSDSALNWLDISKVATRDSSLFYTATIGDEKFIKKIERKIKFPFDSTNQKSIKVEVTILIAATGETTGIIVKDDIPESFVTELEKTIKETTKWFVPINNYKPLSGSRTIVFTFKK